MEIRVRRTKIKKKKNSVVFCRTVEQKFTEENIDDGNKVWYTRHKTHQIIGTNGSKYLFISESPTLIGILGV